MRYGCFCILGVPYERLRAPSEVLGLGVGRCRADPYKNYRLYGYCYTLGAALRELKLNHHDPETILFTKYLYHGNLK